MRPTAANIEQRRPLSRLLRQTFGPGAVSWTAIGAVWTTWLVAAAGAPKVWGALMAVSAVWSALAATDRLALVGAVRRDVAWTCRASTVALGALALQPLIATPLQHLPAWLTVVLLANLFHLSAPFVGRGPMTPGIRALVSDLKASVAVAGIVVFLAALAAALGGHVFGPERFAWVVAAAVFCAGPTMMTARLERSSSASST